MTTGLRLGAPGVYRSPQVAEPAFRPVRLDVAGFAGVTLRGPVDRPTPVTSWSDYQRIFGAFEGPAEGGGGPDRSLPYAVQAFFAQGGARAYVVRVAAPEPPPGSSLPGAAAATARLRLAIGALVLELAAADEGSWGNRLAVTLDYDVARPFRATLSVGPGGGHEVELPVGSAVAPGSLLRIGLADPPAPGLLRWAAGVVERRRSDGTRRRVAPLDTALPWDDGAGIDIEVITAVLDVDDGDPLFPRRERLTGLGLRAEHPRFVVPAVRADSQLVRASGTWPDIVAPDPGLRPVVAEQPTPRLGQDRWDTIDFRSFFDDGPADGDPLDEDHHRGVDALGRVPEIGLLCLPDLQWRWQGAPVPDDPPPPRPATGRFEPEPCAQAGPEPAVIRYAAPPAPPARLDARDPGERAEIVARQQRLVQVAELRRRFVALLDVPGGLPVADIADWRARFDSTYVAAYHPWLGVPRAGDPRSTIVEVPPSAFAAGITAGRERRLGLAWGPAGELAAGAVLAADVVTDAEHDTLHVLGVNVYRPERDGLRLTAAHTLSSDPDYRQLSVRRFMTMLALTLDRQAQWLVFEPNTPELRGLLQHALTLFLRDQFRRGAFAGDTEDESFFVRCDDSTNPPSSQGEGRLVAEVGVAPVAPLEYLVLRISQDTDGAVSVVADRG